MKGQGVMLRAMVRKSTWLQAAEILGNSTSGRGVDRVLDRRRCRPSEKTGAAGDGGAGAELYREKYFDFNVRNFHEN